MKLIVAIVRPFKVAEIVDAMEADPSFPGMTVLECRGFGREKSAPGLHLPAEALTDFVGREAILIAVADADVDRVAQRLAQVARTGKPGDGKLFVVPLDAALRIATGETGDDALS